MPTTTINDQQVEVDEEGFLLDPTAWTEELGAALARLIGIAMSERHWIPIRFLRDDYDVMGETATLRRVSTRTGVPVKELFTLFPGKPAKKMAYVAGLPKPRGCV